MLNSVHAAEKGLNSKTGPILEQNLNKVFLHARDDNRLGKEPHHEPTVFPEECGLCQFLMPADYVIY